MNKQQHCENCGLYPMWDGKPMKLQLHIVMPGTRGERQEMLCPNCHSQRECEGHCVTGYAVQG